MPGWSQRSSTSTVTWGSSAASAWSTVGTTWAPERFTRARTLSAVPSTASSSWSSSQARAVGGADVEIGDHRLAALAAGDERDVRDARLEGGGERVVLVVAVRGDDDRGVVAVQIDRAAGDAVADRAAELGERVGDRRLP